MFTQQQADGPRRHISAASHVGAGVLLLLSVVVSQITAKESSTASLSGEEELVGLSPRHERTNHQHNPNTQRASATMLWNLAALCDNDLDDDDDEDFDSKRRKLRRLLLDALPPMCQDDSQPEVNRGEKDEDEESGASLTSDVGSICDGGHDCRTSSAASCAETSAVALREAPLPPAVIALAVSFLPLGDALSAGTSCKAFAQAVRSAFPLTPEGFRCVRYVPRCPAWASAAESSSPGRTCATLEASTNSSASVASTRRQAPRGGDGVRLFVGQLRRDNTNDFPRFLCSSLAPEIHVNHIEAHTGASNRGKGCAWVNVASASDAAALLAFNRRLFLHMDHSGNEVVLVAQATEESKEALRVFAEQANLQNERAKHLPRQPVVVEVPSAPSCKPVKEKKPAPQATHFLPPSSPSAAAYALDDGARYSSMPAYFSRTAPPRMVATARSIRQHDPYAIDVLGTGRMCASATFPAPSSHLW